MEREGALKGLILLSNGYIVDLLTIDDRDSLRAAVAVACAVAKARPSQESERWLGILALPVFQPILTEFGFKPGECTYPMVVHILDSTLTASALEPLRWQISRID